MVATAEIVVPAHSSASGNHNGTVLSAFQQVYTACDVVTRAVSDIAVKKTSFDPEMGPQFLQVKVASSTA